MADYLNEVVKQAIALQGTPNAPSTDLTDYYTFMANVIAPQLPTGENVDDTDMVGDGFSRVGRNIWLYYWDSKQISIGGKLNDHISGILMTAFLGGSVTTTNLTAPAKDYSTVMNVANSTPKLLSLYRHLGGEQFISGTLGVNNFTITQEGSAVPMANFDLLGTGFHLDPDELAALPAAPDEGDLNDGTADYQYFHGAATEITATDGVTSYNWTTAGDLISLSIEGGNNLDVARRTGDPFKDPLKRVSGAYARKIRMGKSSGLIKLKVDLGSSLPEFKTMIQRKKLTGLTVVFNGFDKISTGVLDHEFEIKAPAAQFEMVEGDTDQDFGALSLTIRPTRDAVTKGRYTHRLRTAKTLLGA